MAGCLLASRSAHAVIVTSGVGFSQESFDFDTDTDNESVDAQATASLPALDAAAGLSGSGFLNVATSSGWVVQNMYVANPSEAADMLLPITDGTTDGSLAATVDFSATPSSSFTNSAPHTFGVSQKTEDAEGFGGNPAAGYKPTEAANTLSFSLNPIFSFNFQTGHPNIQAADNQCFPAAVANSLDWLRKTYGLPFPQPNTTGLGNAGGSGTSDGTLVGTLDVDMNRAVTNRSSGSPVDSLPGLQGKLKFLADNNLTNVMTSYQGTAGNGNALPGSVSVTSSGRTMQANSAGGVITGSFIQSEVMAGEDVEMGFIYPGGGGHFVEITGAGSVGGIPWITYVSDLAQTPIDPTDTMGTDTVQFSFLSDTNANGTLNLVNEAGQPEATFLISESLVPEPASAGLMVMALGLVAAKRGRRQRVS